MALAYLLSSPPRRWFWARETVTKTVTVWQPPWYMDAFGLSLILLIGMAIVWGIQGGFPRV